MNGDFDAIIDVRSQAEWDSIGHIMNATSVPDLASTGSPDSILSCQDCILAVYCGSGVRAGQAIQRLISDYGFDPSKLYNGLGVTQWQQVGYTLIFTESVLAPCQQENCTCHTCSLDPTTTTTTPPTATPTTLPVVTTTTPTTSDSSANTAKSFASSWAQPLAFWLGMEVAGVGLSNNSGKIETDVDHVTYMQASNGKIPFECIKHYHRNIVIFNKL